MEVHGGDHEEVRDWSLLPADLVRSCSKLLDCNVDRANMIAQCSSWLPAIGSSMSQKQLPWMLVPH
jgi:hypothetical protein